MISCNQHDYIEIVCVYHYPIQLTLKSGEVIQGVAIDTAQNENRNECIKIDTDGIQRLVVLDEIRLLEIKQENPHVQKIIFA